MKKIVLIALTLLGAGVATSKADIGFRISFGNNCYRYPAPVYVVPYNQHDAYHQDLADDHAAVHYDLKQDHRQFHRATRRDPSLRYEHRAFHRELKQDHGAFHHEANHDHERFHGYDY